MQALHLAKPLPLSQHQHALPSHTFSTMELAAPLGSFCFSSCSVTEQFSATYPGHNHVAPLSSLGEQLAKLPFLPILSWLCRRCSTSSWKRRCSMHQLTYHFELALVDVDQVDLAVLGTRVEVLVAAMLHPISPCSLEEVVVVVAVSGVAHP